MYNAMQRDFYWPHKADENYATVCDCQLLALHCHNVSRQRKQHLYLPNRPLQFVAIDILGRLPETRSGSQHVIVTTDRYSKLTKATPTVRMTGTTFASFFLNNRISSYEIPVMVLTDNCSPFASMFFKSICIELG